MIYETGNKLAEVCELWIEKVRELKKYSVKGERPSRIFMTAEEREQELQKFNK